MKDVSELLISLIEINDIISKENEHLATVSRMMEVALNNSNADVCFFYNIDKDDYMSLDYSVNKSLKISKQGIDNLSYASIINIEEQRYLPKKSIAMQSALNKEIICYNHIYTQTSFDNSFFENYDDEHNYRTNSVLTIPLMSRKNEIIAVAQFVNAQDENGKSIPFSPDTQKVLIFICNLLSLIVENRRLRESYGHLLESFIEVVARAIDAKSTYTGNHCQNVPVITRMLATAAVQEETGSLASFELTPDEWYSIHIASWLHDCGKLTTPEYIVDKATKLETISNRIHEIRNRFEILRRDAHIDYLKKRLQNYDTPENLQSEFLTRVAKLEDDFDFIAKCNIGDNRLSEEDIKRLEGFSQIKFRRYFNRMLGLSWAERDAVVDQDIYTSPFDESLLQEGAMFNGYNIGEIYNLSIRQGTINKEEREKINEHIIVTINMLKALPFPKNLSKVVEYAGSHHERIDGKGYPNGLTGEEMSIPAKIIAIADIFEALTASDRPYKETKKLSQVLEIMKKMKDTGHIDPDLYRVFLTNKVYMEYATQYMNEEQIDEINPGDYL